MDAKEFSAQFAPLREAARPVTEAYQNAQRFLDAVKEAVLVDMGMPVTAGVFHALAHEQPVRFDRLGDYLHQRGVKQEYPATSELTEEVPDLGRAFEIAVGCLQEIDGALSGFIQTAGRLTGCEAVARAAEGMEQENSGSFEKLLTAWTLWDGGSRDAAAFECWMQVFFGGDGV